MDEFDFVVGIRRYVAMHVGQKLAHDTGCSGTGIAEKADKRIAHLLDFTVYFMYFIVDFTADITLYFIADFT